MEVVYPSTNRHILEDITLHNNRCENLRLTSVDFVIVSSIVVANWTNKMKGTVYDSVISQGYGVSYLFTAAVV
jgi:hypothetical protein